MQLKTPVSAGVFCLFETTFLSIVLPAKRSASRDREAPLPVHVRTTIDTRRLPDPGSSLCCLRDADGEGKEIHIDN